MTSVAVTDAPAPTERARWKSVAVPTEHGGWGLTLEPVLLGLIVVFSWSGLAIGVAAFGAFLVRTPLKLALVDRRRGRSLPRTRLATRIGLAELVLIGALGAVAFLAAGPRWLVPVAIAIPLVAIELWFDIRSRSRRLVPELAGAVGIASVVGAIVLAGDETERLAIALWLVLAGRVIASIPYVRAQITRVRRGSARLGTANAFQVAGAIAALTSVGVDRRALVGAVAVVAVAIAQFVAMRLERMAPVKVIGVRQMALGLTVVAFAAAGVVF